MWFGAILFWYRWIGLGRLRFVMATAATAALGASAPSAALIEGRCGTKRLDAERRGAEWSGQPRQGLARTADSSTEAPASLLFSREQVWSGQPRTARVRHGEVRQA